MKQIVKILSILILSNPLMAQKEINYTTTVENWHAKRIQDLKLDDGWLS